VDKTTNFVILGTQRTGTTLVRTCLSSHPDIMCCGEVFNLGKSAYSLEDGYWWHSNIDIKHKLRAFFRPQKATAMYIDQLYSNTQFAAIGFKFMLNQCLTRPHIWSLLTKKNLKVLLVRRHNALKTLVSRRTAAESGVYHVSKTLPARSAVKEWTGSSIKINATTLIDDLNAINSETAAWRTRLDDKIEYIDIDYEEYVDDMEAGNRKILNFLDVRQLPLTSDLKKVNRDDLSTLISNYGEVAKVLQNTKYATYLDRS